MWNLCCCCSVSSVFVIVLDYRAKNSHPHLSHGFVGHGGWNKAHQIRCWWGWEGLLPLPKNQGGPKGGSWRPILPKSLRELPAQLHLHTQVWHMHRRHFLKLLVWRRSVWFSGLLRLLLFENISTPQMHNPGLNVWMIWFWLNNILSSEQVKSTSLVAKYYHTNFLNFQI